MVLMRAFSALAAVAIIAAAAVGCSSGLSEGDAKTQCNQEMAAKGNCFDTNVFNMCVSCYERCGASCTPQATCPSTYLCPGDAPIDAGPDAL